jgi:hypothetical protein
VELLAAAGNHNRIAEVACKPMIGRRIKQTGPRSRVRRANRMATLSCSLQTDAWKVTGI